MVAKHIWMNVLFLALLKNNLRNELQFFTYKFESFRNIF